ncbi:hypothetical protein AYO46_00820 [Betaproteobacteria bacterium SCGC AG-212-J23]|nr:hypothetical protein AYO46_00820 [Betaproteobacteria bacterium SCGC AG-212-J23]
MSHQSALIDGFEFAAAGATRQGVWAVGDFPRLRDLLVSDAGDIRYEIDGVHDAHGRPALRVRIRGTLQLRCQRCLEAMRFEVDTDEMLVLAATQAEIDAEPADANSPDRLLAAEEVRVRDLLEDELILALPYAPRHEECEVGADAEGDAKISPFAGLRGMLKH